MNSVRQVNTKPSSLLDPQYKTDNVGRPRGEKGERGGGGGGGGGRGTAAHPKWLSDKPSGLISLANRELCLVSEA